MAPEIIGAFIFIVALVLAVTLVFTGLGLYVLAAVIGAIVAGLIVFCILSGFSA